MSMVHHSKKMLNEEETKKAGDVSKAFGGSGSLTPDQMSSVLKVKQAFAPVGSLSSENAQTTVEKQNDYLNTVSSYYNTVPQNNTPSSELPKAYFANELGQQASFSEDQLKNNKTRDFLDKNGYVMTNTEGPSYDTGAGIKSESEKLDNMYENLLTDFMSYNVDMDPELSPVVQSIRGQYDKLRTDMQRVNESRMASFETLGIRSGTRRYAGAVQMGIEGEELRQGNERIGELYRQENQAISDAKVAFRNGKYSEFNQKINLLKELRDNKAQKLKDYNDKLAKIIENNKKEIYQSSRDASVASLMAQGVTDPIQMLDFLNFDEQGNQIGDFTAEEIAKTMKNLAKETSGGDVDKLSGDIRDFYILQKEHPETIPEFIKNLDPAKQLPAWIEYMNPKKTSEKTTKVNKITLSEADSRGLPFSVVGLSEENVIASLHSPEAPNWFVEKVAQEKGVNYNPPEKFAPYLKTLWNNYKAKYLSEFENGKNKNENEDYVNKAKKYFNEMLDGASEEDIEKLAETVQFYIENGELSYKEAIKKVEDESIE